MKGMRDTVLKSDMKEELKEYERTQSMNNSLVLDDLDYHAGYPNQLDKPRRGPRGTPEGILANVNKPQKGNARQYFDEVTHRITGRASESSQGRRDRTFE